MNVLQITGNAVVTGVHDIEGRSNIALHLEIYNPSPTESVQIIDHRRYYLSSGGWVAQGPWGGADFFGVPAVRPGERRMLRASATEVGLASHLLLDVQVRSGTRTENVIAQLPVVMAASTRWTEFPLLVSPRRAPLQPPEPLPFEHDRYPILLQEPVDVFPVMDGSRAWLVLTGQIANPWRRTLRLCSFHYEVEDGEGDRITGTLPLRLRSDEIDAANHAVWVDFATQVSSAGLFSFHHAIAVPASTIARWQWVTLTASEQDGRFTRRVAISTARAPYALRYPVDHLLGGWWVAWNAPAHHELTAHNAVASDRYALDLVAEKLGDTRKEPAGRGDDNRNFWAYGVPVRAMDDGVVVYVRSTVPDALGSHGYRVLPPGGGSWPARGNVVVLRHADQRYSLYAHLASNSAFPPIGTHVTAGTQIGSIGNSGDTTEPHLHVAHWTFDPITGAHRALPMAFSNVTTTEGAPLRGVIAGDNRVHVVPLPSSAHRAVVPDCVDRTETQARQLLSAAGLRVGSIVFRAGLPGGPPLRRDHLFAVVDQHPRAGTAAASGSPVNLTMARECSTANVSAGAARRYT